MSRVDLIFTAAALLLLPLMGIESPLFQEVELFICGTLIATLGISHGAIDNHLYGFKDLKGNLNFIVKYLLVGGLFGLIWFFNAALAFSIFLLISSFHFGQSQFINVKGSFLGKNLLYTSWGLWFLSAFVYLNKADLSSTGGEGFLFSFLMDNMAFFGLSFLTTSLILLGLFIYAGAKQVMSLERIFKELYEMALISAVLFLYSPLLGFSLYFIILHSLRVLNQEYKFLMAEGKIKNIIAFIKLLSPFTILSIAGMAIFVALVELLQFTISLPLAALIFISCLTVPHALVMNRFYSEHRPD